MTARPAPSVPAHPGTDGVPWPTCHTCGQPLPARAVCRCGHPIEVHDIHRHGRRGACSRSEGPKATPCGCRQYEGAS